MSFDKYKLPIAVAGGKPRAGKGETVKHFSMQPGVVSDETGSNYRAVTWRLLRMDARRGIELGMSRDVIGQRIAQFSLAHLEELADSREEIMATHGKDALYAPEVASLVGEVAPHKPVRTAVKQGFIKRIEGVRDSDEHRLLVVDGRNLEPVIESVEDVELVMRTFMSVHPVEAAYRECLRLDVDPMSSEGQQILAETIRRGESDATRTNDPVKPDQDAINFSHDPELRERALGRLAEHMFGGDIDAARIATADTLDWPPVSRVQPREIGRVAAAAGLQIAIDTTAFRGYEDPDDFETPDRPTREMFKVMDGILNDALALSDSRVGSRR
jgi:cytidylate kinase